MRLFAKSTTDVGAGAGEPAPLDIALGVGLGAAPAEPMTATYEKHAATKYFHIARASDRSLCCPFRREVGYDATEERPG